MLSLTYDKDLDETMNRKEIIMLREWIEDKFKTVIFNLPYLN